MFVVIFDYGYEGYGLPQFFSDNIEQCKLYIEDKNSSWAWREQRVNWTKKDDILYLDDPDLACSRYEGWIVFEIRC